MNKAQDIFKPIKNLQKKGQLFIVAVVLLIVAIGLYLTVHDLKFLKKSITGPIVQPPVASSIGPMLDNTLPGPDAPLVIASVSDVALDPEEEIFLSLINDYRVQNGAPVLDISPTLTAAAQWKANDMATNDYFSHTDSLGRDPFQMMSDFGYDYNTWKGENLAAGCETADLCFELWKNSPGHNSNMLNPNFVVIGIARAYNLNSTYGWYWATDFGGYYDVPAISIDQLIVAGPAAVTISHTQGKYMWVMAKIRNLTDNHRVVTTVLSTSSPPSGCDKMQQLFLPAQETFLLLGNEAKWVLYRERYECHNSSPGVYSLNISLQTRTDLGLDQTKEISKSLILH